MTAYNQRASAESEQKMADQEMEAEEGVEQDDGRDAATTKAAAKKEPKVKRERIEDRLKVISAKTTDLKEIAKELNSFRATRGDDIVIKDVIITGIVSGKETEDIVKEVHETFADHPSITPNTSSKDIAFYRTRLRTVHNLPIPKATRPKAEEVAGPEGGEDGAEATSKGKKGKKNKAERMPKAAEAEEEVAEDETGES